MWETEDIDMTYYEANFSEPAILRDILGDAYDIEGIEDGFLDSAGGAA